MRQIGWVLGAALYVAACGGSTEAADRVALGDTVSSGDAVSEPSDAAGTPDAALEDAAGEDTHTDAPEPVPDAGSDAGSGGPDTQANDTGGGPDSGPSGSACLGDADLAIVTTSDLFAVAGGCAPGCLGQPPGCSATCIEAETGLSSGCAGCVGALADCAAASCGLQCLGGPSNECATCAIAACGAPFEACSGVTIPEPPPCEPQCAGKACGSDGCGSECGTCDAGICDASGQCAAEPVDACAGDSDTAVLETADISAVGQQCAFDCIANPDAQACSAQCISDGTGLTFGCGYCVAGLIGCIVQSCLEPCLAGPAAAACLQCQEDLCNPTFEACAGIELPEPTPCEPSCDDKACGADGCGGSCGACAPDQVCAVTGACEAVVPAACANDDDAAILAQADVPAELQTCGLDCLGQPETCVANCVELSMGLTPSCGLCVAGVSTCSVEACLQPCATGPSECLACQDQSCGAAFETCSGVPLVDVFGP